MRELKFRAWCWYYEEKMYPVYSLNYSGWEQKGGEAPLKLADVSVFDDRKEVWNWVRIPRGFYELMEYTPFKDKNQKLICEGDILKFKADYVPMEKAVGWLTGVMAKNDYGWVLKVGEVEYDIKEETEEFPYTAEVIGDIHQNKELLK